MASPRETRFFSEDTRFSEGLPAYELNHFAGWNGEPAVGEKCPEYLYLPHVPQRIFDSLGSAVKMIICLRSPAARAYSHYRHNIAQFREARRFSDIVEDEGKRLITGERIAPPYGYLARGLYAEQVERYLRLFGEEQCHFIAFEMITRHQSQAWQGVCDFLNIAPQRLNRKIAAGRPPTLLADILPVDGNQDVSVTVQRKPSGRARASLLQRTTEAFQNKDSVQQGSAPAIRNPSQSLLRHAEDVRALGAISPRLPRDEEIRLNRKYFADDIAGLQDMVPFDTHSWLAAD